MSQRFCLRWNNHQSNMLSVFDQLLHDESFVDVTLAVDGQLLRAHKMVLSACSPLFQALFIGHPDKHPIVILKDVPYNDMRCLLDFMYRGEVSVDQDRLTAFLKVAESLRIKGLTEVNEEKCDIPSITNNLLSAIPCAHSTPAAAPIPHIQRIPGPQKRPMPPLVASNPLLGSALTAPKRKRGRPRKLSGSSDDPHGHDGSSHEMDGDMDIEYENRNAGSSDHSSPPPQDMMEMRMDYGRHNSLGKLNKTSERDDSSGLEDSSSQSPHKETLQKTATVRTPSRRGKEDAEPTPGTSSQVPLLIPKTEALSRSVDHPNNNNNTKDGGKDQSNATPNANSSVDGSDGVQSDVTTTPSSGRQPSRRRARRRAASSSQDPAEALTEMSVRGLNLFRYASVTEGVYKCMECAKVDVIKTFKNKYSFQRHAFLYHEGHQRKVFPCPVCAKEFSRPDKMKNHMKTVHDCFMPKDCVFPVNFYMPEGSANFQ
ncbi:protein tramtrack, alpha isoform-like isoform X3 [Thrips palmi]|uniref:Protein tramtrack, alpha isoform-like isoform X3 n=1 Tax=Thrips palmi TaxID=161013 RepID=A0A6P8YAV1_THRPL|nr:protein tramtrack, alpha isoform-like isoform X3 [Thrips palmi]